MGLYEEGATNEIGKPEGLKMGEREDAREAAEHREWQMDKLHDKLARLERIEAAAREVIRIEEAPLTLSGITRSSQLITALDALRLALRSGKGEG